MTDKSLDPFAGHPLDYLINPSPEQMKREIGDLRTRLHDAEIEIRILTRHIETLLRSNRTKIR
jgi:hypothetical protein